MAKAPKRSNEKKGRPTGSLNNQVQHAEAQPSRCPTCGSTKRTAYHDKLEQDYAGEHDGRPYTHVIRRRTECVDCGQHRVDHSYEFRPEAWKGPLPKKPK